MKYAYRSIVGPSFVTLIALAGLACGSSKGSGFGDNGSSGGSGGSGSGGGSGGSGSSGGGSSGGSGSSGSFGDAAPPPGGDGGSNCTVGAGKYIYVVSDNNTLYTFDPTLFPSASAFVAVGMVPCVPSGGYVNSMAIDRQANAYVNTHPDGKIWKVTTTAPVTCTMTGFQTGQGTPPFSNDLGMGFAADSKGAATDTLYVSDNSGPLGVCTQTTPAMGSCWGLGLASVDLTSWTLHPVGVYTSTAAGYNAELTGTGNGDLFGFFTTTPSSYGLIDKTSGHTDTPPPTVENSVTVGTGGYAFSFWNGDFYFYTAPSGNTVPQHLTTKTGTVTPGEMLSFVIVGAGVSTCAPVGMAQ
jgi:hypothetical protein